MELVVHGEDRRVYTYRFFSWDTQRKAEDTPLVMFKDTEGGDVEVTFFETRHLTLNGNFEMTLKISRSELSALAFAAAFEPRKRDWALMQIQDHVSGLSPRQKERERPTKEK